MAEMSEGEWAELFLGLDIEELNVVSKVVRAILENKSSNALKVGYHVKFLSQKHGGWRYGRVTKLNPKMVEVMVHNPGGMTQGWKVARSMLIPISVEEYQKVTKPGA